MRSKASLKSHPIHPMLITFPIAFFVSAFLFDIFDLPQLDSPTGRMLNIAGIITALLAAVPGIVDYLFTVPPESSAKKRATKHGLLNVTVVILFCIALWQRKDGSVEVVVILEGIGVVLLGISGWLGGTLVYRNQIGVDPRYAGAGKWKDERYNSSESVVEVGSAADLQINQMKLVVVGGKRIVIARSDDGYRAFDDRCTHRGGSLAGGAMICGTVQCPWHGSQFSVHDGSVRAKPAEQKVGIYPVEERAQKLYLKIRG